MKSMDEQLQIGYIGLGKMGKNMVIRMQEHNVNVLAWNRSPEPRKEVSDEGVPVVETVEELIEKLESPRIVWMMLTAGEAIDKMIDTLIPLLSPGDLLIDGANSNYKDTMRRHEKVIDHNIRYMDIGVSGGPEGARNGACCMVGGSKDDYAIIEPLLRVISAPYAYGYFGDHGAGHFTKMVHNGIEYGMMQAIAEGMAVLEKSDLNINLEEVLRVYNSQSVIESRLIGWTKKAIHEDKDLSHTTSKIGHTGEGKWTIEAADELGIDTPVMDASYKVRLESTEESESFRDKVVQAQRVQFGGPRHEDPK